MRQLPSLQRVTQEAGRFPLTLLCAAAGCLAGGQVVTYLSSEANQPAWTFPLLSAGLLVGWYALAPALPGLVWGLRLAVLLLGLHLAVAATPYLGELRRAGAGGPARTGHLVHGK